MSAATIQPPGVASVSPAALPFAVWRAPLVPAALAFTAGILIDRLCNVPVAGSLFLVLAFLSAWVITLRDRPLALPLLYLALAVASMGAAYHQYRRNVLATDDISLLALEKSRPVELRGILDQEPRQRWHPQHDPLQPSHWIHGYRGPPPEVSTVAVLRVQSASTGAGWQPASGRVQLLVPGKLRDLHCGDSVEAAGRLLAPPPPSNPGENDHREELRDRGISAVLRAERPEAVCRLEENWQYTVVGWLARLRRWGVAELERAVPRHSGLAAALVLGDDSRLPSDEWQKYARTGIIHVLIVSGQQLVVLAGFLWFVLRALRLRQRQCLGLVVGLLWFYALLTGGRPPVLRAVVVVTVFAGAVLLRRVPVGINALALAWLVVLLVQPSDVRDLGCLLTFLCVATLHWYADLVRRREKENPIDPLQQLLLDSEPLWKQGLRRAWQMIATLYLVNALLWCLVAPLAASRIHTLSLVGLLIGPPIIVGTGAALIAGFLTLLSQPLGVVQMPFAWATGGLLSACDWLVNLADGLPGAFWFIGPLASWWLIGFYLLAAVVFAWPQANQHGRKLALAGAAWLCVGLLAGVRLPPGELRVTFLAVGHGNCTVIETPDGRVLLYDVGSLKGPSVVRHQIAPFLWHRGIRRIDEVLLSHADLDHINGLPELCRRFTVGQVTVTPSLREQSRAGLRHVIEQLQQRQIPIRTVQAGQRLRAGEVTLEVLHPPGEGPPGEENVRSLVLLIRHGERKILLTGDLEKNGLERVLTGVSSPAPVDVMMAPHHGSNRRKDPANSPALARWSRPVLVISSQAGLRGESPAPTYAAVGAEYLTTHFHGAVTIRSRGGTMTVETFLTQKKFPIRR